MSNFLSRLKQLFTAQPQPRPNWQVESSPDNLTTGDSVGEGETQARVPQTPPTVDAEPVPTDFFISHSSIDKAHANLLWRALEKRGYKCWIAPESIGKGEDWPTAIERGVKHSKVLALILNGRSAASGEVRTELAFAKEYGAKIVSIRLEDVPKENILKYFIWDKQWISADSAPFPSLVDNVAVELEKALKNANIALAFGPIKKGVRPPDSPSAQAANEDLATALKSKGQKAKRIFQAVAQGANELDAIDQNGRTALHWAAQKNEIESAKRSLGAVNKLRCHFW